MKKEILKIENVNKSFGNEKALKNVSFSIDEGEVVGLVGSNGAGKTTLMKIIVGLIRNYEGSVYLEGKNIRKIKNSKDKNFGCVIETPGFYPHLTGYENLKALAPIAGCEDLKEIDEIVKIVKIEEFMNKKARKYSLGMKQRLGIAQAVIGNPKVLILDEPTNGLDPNVILEIRKLVEYLSKEKKIAVIISSHILSEIESVCKKVVFIKKGEVVDILSIDKESKKKNNIYVLESREPRKLAEYLYGKNISVIKELEDKIIADLDEYRPKDVFKMLENTEIAVDEIYKEKQSLEKIFIEKMGGDSCEK